MATTTELYETAIEKLQCYVDGEPDRAKRDAATLKIRRLRLAIQEANFDDMTQRTARLQGLAAALQEIIDMAGDGSGVSGAIAEITALLGEMV